MKLTVLGSGVFKPRTARYPSGLALTIGDKTIIFDAGSGTFMRLIEAGIDYEQIDYIFVTHLHIEVKVKEVDEGDAIFLPFFKIKVMRTHHVDELVSICYKIEAKKKIFGYSGDTGYSEKLIEFFKGVDVLVLECTTLNEQKIKGHLIPKECAEIAKKAGVKKLVLTHLDLDLEKVKEQCSRDFCGEIVVAEDLMQVEI